MSSLVREGISKKGQCQPLRISWQVLRRVHLLDGNLKKGAHVWSEIGNFICIRYLFLSIAITFFMYYKRTVFLPMCTSSFDELPYYISTMLSTLAKIMKGTIYDINEISHSCRFFFKIRFVTGHMVHIWLHQPSNWCIDLLKI